MRFSFRSRTRIKNLRLECPRFDLLSCLDSRLTFRTVLSSWHQLESLHIQRLATANALAIGAVFNSAQRSVDVLDQVGLTGREFKGYRPIKVEFRHFTDVLYAVITFQRGGSVGAQIFSCLLPLPDQEIAEVFQLFFVHYALLSDLRLVSGLQSGGQHLEGC